MDLVQRINSLERALEQFIKADLYAQVGTDSPGAEPDGAADRAHTAEQFGGRETHQPCFRTSRGTAAVAGDAEKQAVRAAKETVKYGATSSGAMRASIGTKINTHLVPYELVVAAAVGLNYGAGKYAPRNFEKGLTYISLTMSIERHNRAIIDGEYLDEDSGLPHYMLLASSVAMLCHNIMQGRIEDDRPKAKLGRSISFISELGHGILNARDSVLELMRNTPRIADHAE